MEFEDDIPDHRIKENAREKMVSVRKKGVSNRTVGTWTLIHEKERAMIEEWREGRTHDFASPYGVFLAHTFTFETVKSFIQNINFMVLIHVIISVTAVFIFQKFGISFDTNVALFVSPIVFPLAFSINSDFQRREKVLEDLATFKSAGMSWYFCMREWKTPAGLDGDWMNEVHKKLKSVLFYLCEYLLTHKVERRNIILRAIYEDFSDANELVEKLRASKLPTNTAVVSRSIHLLHTMGMSFERLRVIRDYRSPRSIRSFNKVFILMLPIILGPYFVHLGHKDNNCWQSYYLAVILAFVFSTLQVVQDKLDDPFDGMGEDDINVDTIDEWAPILEVKDRKQPNWNVGPFPSEPFYDLNARRGAHCYEDNIIRRIEENASGNNTSEESLSNAHAQENRRTSGEHDANKQAFHSSNFTVYSSPEVNEAKEDSSVESIVRTGHGTLGNTYPTTEKCAYDLDRIFSEVQSNCFEEKVGSSLHLKMPSQRLRRSLSDCPEYRKCGYQNGVS